MIATDAASVRGGRRLFASAVACVLLLAAFAAPFIITVEPAPPAEGWPINVRWAPGVSQAQRAALEARYRLGIVQRHDDRTWVYRLSDPSRENIRALVVDPLAEDTSGIDRSAHRLSTPRITLAELFAERHPEAAERLEDALTWRNVLAIAVAIAFVIGLTGSTLRRVLSRGIPPLSAAGLGLYRMALGAALAAVVIKYDDLPNRPFPRELHRAYDWFANWEWVHRLAENPGLVKWAVPVCLGLLAAFALGVFARASYLGFLGILTAYVFVVLQHKSAHDWGLPLITLWGLAVVPWDAGLGIRRRHSDVDGNYGFAIWFPGLMIGLAFLAAAWAKLDSSGLAWVTGGAVKYHFLEDWSQAPTDWGLRVAGRPGLAVALSAGAILVEGLFILHVFFRSPLVRVLFAIPALVLLAGFRLLQGVVWTQWWVLFLAFVPWQAIAARINRREAPRVTTDPRPALHGGAAAVVAVAVGVQVVASSARLEMEPFVSDYGMYSWTWPSREGFDAHLARKYRVYAFRAWRDDTPAEDVTGRLSAMSKATDLLADVVDSARSGAALSDERRRALGAMASAYRDTYGDSIARMLVLVTEQAFDWQEGRFYTKSREAPVGVLDTRTGALTAP